MRLLRNREQLSSRGAVGKMGETVAAAFFRAKGFKVVARNWRVKIGEIDLIVCSDSTIVFVEVKSRLKRSANSVFHPFDNVGPRKQAKLRTLVELYLRRHPSYCSLDPQIDLLGVSFEPRFPFVRIEHLPSAF